MKKGINRKDFLRGSLAISAATVAFPSVLEGLSNTESADNADKAEVPSEALKYISSVSFDKGFVHVGGWNDDGFFCNSHRLDTGELYFSYHIYYRNMPMVNDKKQRTLAQLRADNVPWEEIDRLNILKVYNFIGER